MDRPFKIALVSGYDYAVSGGVNDHIASLGAQLRSWDHDVRIVAPCSDVEQVDEEGFVPMGRPVPIPSGGSVARVSLSMWLKPRIRDLLRREQFDVVHLHEPFAGLVTAFMISQSRSLNVATFHSYKGGHFYGIGGTKLAMPYFRKLHGLIAVSTVARNYIRSYFPGEYEIIPNGIRVEDFSDGVEPFPHLRDGMVNILFLGRLEKRKGLRYLLEAYSRLKWEWPNLRLIVVGGGDPDPESHRIMSERNLQDVVFTGAVSNEDRARYYKSADIYCSPATGNESFGIVLLEAMAAGAPIVASSIEGYAGVVTHGVDGLLVPPKDGAALAAAIEHLLADPGFRERLAENASRTVDEYRWERVARRVIDHYAASMERAEPVRVGRRQALVT
jgi:phosphatidylinositol alpha-mannosyltransferase